MTAAHVAAGWGAQVERVDPETLGVYRYTLSIKLVDGRIAGFSTRITSEAANALARELWARTDVDSIHLERVQ